MNKHFKKLFANNNNNKDSSSYYLWINRHTDIFKKLQLRYNCKL